MVLTRFVPTGPGKLSGNQAVNQWGALLFNTKKPVIRLNTFRCKLTASAVLLQLGKFSEVIRPVKPFQVRLGIFLKCFEAQWTAKFQHAVSISNPGEAAAIRDVLSADNTGNCVVPVTDCVLNAHLIRLIY